jgi:hypothetical protein
LVPRYYVPLNVKGELALRLRLHRGLKALVPEKIIDAIRNLRRKWYAIRVLKRNEKDNKIE